MIVQTPYYNPYPQMGFYGQYCFYLMISMSCWVFFLGTAWASLGGENQNDKTMNIFWLTFSNKEKRYTYTDMNYILHYVCFIGTAIVGTVAFGYYFFLTVNRNFIYLSMINGPFSRYNFVPLICVSILYILGMNFESPPEGTTEVGDGYFIGALVLSLLAISTLIFVYSRTVVSNAYIVTFLIKKGTYTCLISLLIYHVCYVIAYYGKYKTSEDSKASFMKGCGYAFVIIIGLTGVGMSRLYFDLAMAVMTFLIEVGIGLQCINEYKLSPTLEPIKPAGYIAFALAFGAIVLVFLNTTMYRSYIYI